MRYTLSIELKMVEIPEPLECPAGVSETDPVQMLGKVATGIMSSIGPGSIVALPRMPGGMDFRRAAAITVPNVAGLGRIAQQFDDLVNQIQLERG